MALHIYAYAILGNGPLAAVQFAAVFGEAVAAEGQGSEHFAAVGGPDEAARADPVVALAALAVALDELVVEVVVVAQAADEGLVVGAELAVVGAVVDCPLGLPYAG